jgi:hypothetical protein
MQMGISGKVGAGDESKQRGVQIVKRMRVNLLVRQRGPKAWLIW